MKKSDVFSRGVALLLVCGWLLWFSMKVEAGVQGSCANCHTMHNKQHGDIPEGGALEPQSYLIKGEIGGDNPCLGCHAKSNTEPIVDGAPQVTYYNSSSVNEKMLAGGTYFLVNDDEDDSDDNDGKSCQKGHNILDLAPEDGKMKDGRTPPGGSNALMTAQLTCAGYNGCHGDRSIEDPMAAIKGGHHSPETENLRNGESMAKSYRMLYKVQGRVAESWELGQSNKLFPWDGLKTDKNVNIYKGIDNSKGIGLEGTDRLPGDSGSINGLCGECHGHAEGTGGNTKDGFHSSKGIGEALKSPWLRHPTDTLMDKDGTEYWNYPNEGGDYSTEVPVGFTNIENLGNIGKSSRTVLCISCHRAHGSEYDDALRWDYMEMQTGSAKNNGCFRCHTDKSE